MRHQAIRNLYPEVDVIQDGIGCFTSGGNPVALNEPAVEAETQRLLDERAALEYQRQRAREYPSITEQLDILYHGGVESWQQAIKAVKDKYPKPT